MDTSREMTAFRNFFKGRNDTFAIQLHSGGYRRVEMPLDEATIHAHLSGRQTVGMYLIDPKTNTVWLAVIDHDTKDESTFRQLLNTCEKVGFEFDEMLLEDSGNKGRHIIFRFEKTLSAEKAMRLGAVIVSVSEIPDKVEVFPKQGKISNGGFGNLVKLPLGIHQVSKKRSCFIDPTTLKPLDSLDLSSIKRIPESKVDEILENFELVPRDDRSAHEPVQGPTMPSEVALPCIDNILAFGAAEGMRDTALFNLCIHLKRKGCSQVNAEMILDQWDKKNKPPLNSEDPAYVRRKIEHVYRSEYTNIACKDLKSFCTADCRIAGHLGSGGKSRVKPKVVGFLYWPEELIAEMVFTGSSGAKFAAIQHGAERVDYTDHIVRRGIEYRPFKDDQIIGRAVFMPSEVTEFGTDEDLLEEIQSFIHANVDLDPVFERLCAYYVMFTYVADCFDVCPYLRFHGDYGTGKSRALETLGHLCYKPTICSGAITASPIFRLIDKYHGTLVIDEADFGSSDETEGIVKILNQGFMRSGFVLRSQEVGRRHEAMAYAVYGPKVLATRGLFRDKALESRCLTIAMRGRSRPDIPLNLELEALEASAIKIRNKLTCWRLRNFAKKNIDGSLRQQGVEDRINQILLPLTAAFCGQDMREEFKQIALELQKRILSDRTLSLECDVAEAIVSLANEGRISIRQIADEVNRDLDDRDKVKRNTVGRVIKNRLGFMTVHGNKGNFIEVTKEEVRRLVDKYGLRSKYAEKTTE